MKRALVFTIPERGHYHPLLGPAGRLRAEGWEVVWATTADVRDELEAAGVERVLLPPGAGPPAPGLRGRALSETIADPEALRGWIRALLVDAQPALVEPFRAMIREVRPSVIAIDTMVYAAAIAAELEGVPWVGWSTSLNPVVPPEVSSELVATLRDLQPARERLFTEHGLRARFSVSDVLSPRGTAVFATEALVPRADDPTVSLVGPSLGGIRPGPVPTPAGTREGLVYVSFGSQAWYQPRRFAVVLEAAERLGVGVVAAMGELANEARADGPSQVRVPKVDQLGVLARADVLVTHAGANSVMESLAAGVPMLLAPICNDQPHNRRFVEQAGAGIGLDLDTAGAPAVMEVLERLLEPHGAPRQAAARIAASYRAHDGAAGAADLARRAAS